MLLKTRENFEKDLKHPLFRVILRNSFPVGEAIGGIRVTALLAGENGGRPEKLLVLLPGIGGDYSGMTSTALAELFYRSGWSVAVLDSTFTWQFYLATGGVLPGFLPQDGENVRRAITLVLDDLKQEKLFNPFRQYPVSSSLQRTD